ncbi:PstS family phosphate ABC transporter substrate-binding protein [Paraburkholderia strydomiana]|uniref:PstS family phosphate ABC transporter substrate-binding protein n=1 Tax=Paraburkholderia strydomiana TaxID=1245417 RepID=UPI0038B9FF5A
MRHPPVRDTDASGAIQVVGNDGMESLLDGFNALFAQTHPEIRFKMYLKGSSTAIPALSSGISAFAPMGRDMWPTDRANFKNAHGYEPVDIKVGYSGWGPRAPFKTPPAVYVNQDNAIPGLTVTQLRQILVAGEPEGDISKWSQIKNASMGTSRQIHVYGMADDGGFATAFRLAHLDGLPFTNRYEALPSALEVLRAVAADPYGIGLVGWFDAAKVPGVRLLPLADAENRPYAIPSQQDLTAERYPFAAFLHIYIDKAPGQPVAPWLIDYLKLALSEPGQTVVAREQNKETGFLPLSDERRKAELEKVEMLSKP